MLLSLHGAKVFKNHLANLCCDSDAAKRRDKTSKTLKVFSSQNLVICKRHQRQGATAPRYPTFICNQRFCFLLSLQLFSLTFCK